MLVAWGFTEEGAGGDRPTCSSDPSARSSSAPR
ncbi:MAG: hypothetical protein ABSG95_13365 [Solirubrobacteraceae bacterium]